MDTFHLPGWEVLRVEEGEYVYRVTVKLPSLSRFCPSCGAFSNRYGSRFQTYTDKPMDGKRVSLLVNRQRYRCTDCGKTFVGMLPEMDEVRLMTRRLRAYVEEESLKRNFVSIADEVGINEKTVRTIFREYLTRQGQEVKGGEGESLGAIRKRLAGKAQADLAKETSKLCEQPVWYRRLSEEQNMLPDRTVTALKRRYEIACRLADVLGTHQAVSSVLVFGSVAHGDVDERSDVNLFIVCRPEVIPVAESMRLFSQVGSGWHFGSQLNKKPPFATSDIEGIVDGIPVSLHFQIAAWVSNVLREVLLKGALTTRLMPIRPSTLPALLLRGWLLLDRRKVMRNWRDQAQPFPLQLKLNLLQHYMPLLRENLEELVADSERHLGSRLFLFHLNQAVDALASVLFAVNEVYESGDRREERNILPTLERVPGDFLTRFIEVLEGPFDDAGVIYRARLFQQLAAEMLNLAERARV
jgi:predicted nucleotidyltransferase/transposase-like protein